MPPQRIRATRARTAKKQINYKDNKRVQGPNAKLKTDEIPEVEEATDTVEVEDAFIAQNVTNREKEQETDDEMELENAAGDEDDGEAPISGLQDHVSAEILPNSVFSTTFKPLQTELQDGGVNSVEFTANTQRTSGESRQKQTKPQHSAKQSDGVSANEHLKNASGAQENMHSVFGSQGEFDGDMNESEDDLLDLDGVEMLRNHHAQQPRRSSRILDITDKPLHNSLPQPTHSKQSKKVTLNDGLENLKPVAKSKKSTVVKKTPIQKLISEFKDQVDTQISNEPATVYLRNFKDWPAWLAQLQSRAALLDVWKYIDPFETSPKSLGKCPEPHSTLGNAVGEGKWARLKISVVKWYHEQQNLDEIDEWIQRTVDKRYVAGLVRVPELVEDGMKDLVIDVDALETDKGATNTERSPTRKKVKHSQVRQKKGESALLSNTQSQEQRPSASETEKELPEDLELEIEKESKIWSGVKPLTLHEKLRRLLIMIMRERIENARSSLPN